MDLLLDSHVLLWYSDPSRSLPQRAVASIEQADSVFVSTASIWELNIKAAKGKLALGGLLSRLVEECGFSILNISVEHAEAIRHMKRHHGDPFDHMLLAQAKVDHLTLVTHDRILSEYGVPVLLV